MKNAIVNSQGEKKYMKANNKTYTKYTIIEQAKKEFQQGEIKGKNKNLSSSTNKITGKELSRNKSNSRKDNFGDCVDIKDEEFNSDENRNVDYLSSNYEKDYKIRKNNKGE